MTIAIYPGSFNPIHNGHKDLIERAARIFSRVELGIAASPHKSPADLEVRVELAKEVLAQLPNVAVSGYQGLTVDFAKEKGATVILKGIRTVTDFEYEFQMLSMNRALVPGLETVFLAPSEQCSYISSTLVKQIASMGGDIDRFVDPAVVTALSDGRIS